MSIPKRYRGHCCRFPRPRTPCTLQLILLVTHLHEILSLILLVVLIPLMHPPPPDPGASTAGGGAVKVQLPKISLPCFKRSPIYWTTFWDSYESAVHLNSALSDVDRFSYLRSLLERSTFDAIAGSTLSSANYSEAIEILKKRFGNRHGDPT